MECRHRNKILGSALFNVNDVRIFLRVGQPCSWMGAGSSKLEGWVSKLVWIEMNE